MADIKKGSDGTVASGAEILEKFEKESRTRNFDLQSLVKIVYVLCFLFTVYHLAYASGIRFMVEMSASPVRILAAISPVVRPSS